MYVFFVFFPSSSSFFKGRGNLREREGEREKARERERVSETTTTTCAWHSDKTCVAPVVHTARARHMARSSLGGTGGTSPHLTSPHRPTDRIRHGPSSLSRSALPPALMQNVPNLLICFLFPLYCPLLLASGLLHVDRRRPPSVPSERRVCVRVRVWNEMKK